MSGMSGRPETTGGFLLRTVWYHVPSHIQGRNINIHDSRSGGISLQRCAVSADSYDSFRPTGGAAAGMCPLAGRGQGGRWERAIEPRPPTQFFVTILRRLAEFARAYEEKTSPWKGYYRALEYVCSRIRLPHHEEPEGDAASRPSSLILPGQEDPRPPDRSSGGLIVLPNE